MVVLIHIILKLEQNLNHIYILTPPNQCFTLFLQQRLRKLQPFKTTPAYQLENA